MTTEPITYNLTRDDMTEFNTNAPEAALRIVGELGYPDAMTMNLMNIVKITYITAPELIREILVVKPDAFHRDPRSGRLFQRLMGASVFTTEGSAWRRRRRLVQPAFHATRVNAYADTMVQYAQDMVAGWQHDAVVNVERAMTDLTMRIIAKTMFGVDLQQTVDEIGELMQTILRIGETQIKEVIPRPSWWRSQPYREQRTALTQLQAMLTDIIEQRRQTGADEGDLLSMLLLSRDEDGDLLTNGEALAEAITLFIAGHETTAVTLMWSLKLLADHPTVRAKLHDEVDRVLDGRVPTLADLPQMPYTEAVMKETLRLFPAAYSFGRTPLDSVTVGDYTLPPKRIVMVSPYILHRRPDLYDDPAAFRPERFLSTPDTEKSRYAFIPFGAGPRVCLGNTFAMLEIRLLLATIASRVALEVEAGAQVGMQPQITLHPTVNGEVALPMIVHQRATARITSA